MFYQALALITAFLSGVVPLPAAAAANTLDVPYTSQAPQGVWKQPWEDACEEAATVMVDSYYRGGRQKTIGKSEAVNRIKHVIYLEDTKLGFSKDTNAAQIAEIINNFYSWEAYSVSRPTLDQIKAEMDKGRPVIALVHGKALKNPYFKNGGPDYHTVVIKGYDDDRQEFVTNEPGINRGLDYRYPYATMLSALHDFVPEGKTSTGQPVAVFTSPAVSDSRFTDGDNDGLSKSEELSYGTKLWDKDTDRDGFTDGTEVKEGYSPVLNEKRLGNDSLIKTKTAPTVYLIENGGRHAILNEEVFLSHRWRWQDVKVVSERFLKDFEESYIINQ